MRRKATIVNGVSIPQSPPENWRGSTMSYWRQRYPLFYSRYQYNRDVISIAQQIDLDRLVDDEEDALSKSSGSTPCRRSTMNIRRSK